MSKRGDPNLRSLLINGARSVVGHGQPAPWITQLLARRPFNVVVIAVAHQRDDYDGFKPVPPACTMRTTA